MAFKCIFAISIVLFSLVFGRLYKGECPKVKSSDRSHRFKHIVVIFKLPFEVHKEEYVIFPKGNLSIYTHMNPNIMSIVPGAGHCPTFLGLAFDKTWRLVLILVPYISFSFGKKDVACYVDSKIQFAVVVQPDMNMAVVWGCVQINETIHDEAILVLIEHRFMIDSNITGSYGKLALMMLQNKSNMLEEHLEHYNYSVSYFPEEMQKKNCDSLRCPLVATVDYSQYYYFGVGLFAFIVLAYYALR